MNAIKKVLTVFGGLLMLAGIGAGGSSIAMADQTMYMRDHNQNNHNQNYNDNNRYNRDYYNRYMNNYFRNNYRCYYNLGSHHYTRYFNSDQYRYMHARQIIIIDRDCPNNVIYLRNSHTGAYSVNTIVIRVDNDMFYRFYNNVRSNRTMYIRANTGNNTIRFNTVVGDFRTGDIQMNVN